MKNSYLKTLMVACVAAITFIGIQNNTAKAFTEYQDVNGDSFLELGQAYGNTINDIEQKDNRHDDGVYNKELLQDPDEPKEVELHSLKPVRVITQKTKVLSAQFSESETEKEKPTISISDKEKDLFARLVEAEAKGESYEGKVAVATVVLNRVESSEFPNTVTGVITEVVGDSYAFSPVQNGEINKPASDEAKRAVEEALTREDRLNDSIYFYNPDIATDSWIRTREVVKTIDNHVFAK